VGKCDPPRVGYFGLRWRIYLADGINQALEQRS
jgi:hypothetical protein